jgi:phosphate transport system protein
MFEKLKELFGSENLLAEAGDITVKMMEFDHKMFEASRQSLRNSDTSDLPFDFKEMDQEINRYERDVRRNVLTHLTVAGTQNLVPGLALVSIVIDVERIGDYTKNIAELAVHHPERLGGGVHEDSLKSIEHAIEQNFPVVIDALKTHSTEYAREAMAREEETSSNSDRIVNELITQRDPEQSRSDAVSLALYTRYLKRINAHLANIASSMVNPFPRIGFREKRKSS